MNKALNLATCLAVSLSAAAANAHFPWLATNDQGNALLFFSEGIGDRDYHVPECVAKATVKTTGKKSQTLSMEPLEKDGYTGLVSSEKVAEATGLASTIEYGVYHGTMLKYEARHAPLADEAPAPSGKKNSTIAAQPWRDGDNIKLLVTWKGEPLPGAEVSLTDSRGETASASTNKRGVAKFAAPAEGEVGMMVGHTLKEAAGKLKGDDYTSESYYLTLTTNYQPQAEAVTAERDYPELPAPIASFGAAVADGWVYVYSGHTGTEHAHSRENLSEHFCRLKIDGGEEWQSLPMQTTLQGLPLVAHDGKLYRIGGVHSRNAADETEDMHSTDEFACFDPASGEWTALAPLPTPRSSHDAVVIGDAIYVVGGWQLSGESPGEWTTSGLRFDLNHPEAGWQTIAEPSFKRRALATAQLDGKVIVLGGMQEEQGVTNRVDAYDPSTDTWTEMPALPGKPFSWFGVSAWNLGGVLYASGMQDEVYALGPGAKEWTKVGKLSDPRFFHRLLPAGDDALLVVAGASTENGHVGTIERVELTGE